MQILCYAASAYIGVMFGSIILSYVVTIGQLPAEHPANRLWRMTAKLVDPVLARIRLYIKPVRLGNAMLDLSPLVVIVGLNLLQRFVFC